MTENTVPEFKSEYSFHYFSHEVARKRRYVRSTQSEDFLRAVASTCKNRGWTIPIGQAFWRAQLGHSWAEIESLPMRRATAYPADRMKPLVDSAREGRVNAKGIPCLYLATTKDTAMSEVRPWVGAMVSVAKFEATRQLIVVDCSVLRGRYLELALFDRPMLGGVHPENIDRVVWAAIDDAFSEPVSPTDEVADYAATQVIAELFRSIGYDGVGYKSAFGEDAFRSSFGESGRGWRGVFRAEHQPHFRIPERLGFAPTRARPRWRCSQ
jgi:RES domain